LLLVSLFLAHFLGDFTPLSTRRMQAAKATGRPVGPIAAHAGVHAILVAAAVSISAWPGMTSLIAAMGVEFFTHLGIDWGRGRLGVANPVISDPQARAFWMALGIDQLAHYLVLVWIASIVL